MSLHKQFFNRDFTACFQHKIIVRILKNRYCPPSLKGVNFIYSVVVVFLIFLFGSLKCLKREDHKK